MRPRFLPALILGQALCLLAAPAEAQTAFTAFIDGPQSVPSTASTVTGTGSFTLDPFTSVIQYEIALSGPLAGFTAANIRLGTVGVNGGIVVTLAGGPASFSGDATLSAAHVAALVANGLYVNFHSVSFPNGELRGQITPGRDQFIAVLNGANEVPPTATPFSGSGTVKLNANNTVNYDFPFTGLTGSFTGAHIHDAPPGVNGPFIFNLSQGAPNQLLGLVGLFDSVQRAKLRSQLLYVNVHSTGLPNGEMRGQLVPSYLAYGAGCPHGGGLATLSGGGVPTSGGAIHVDIANGVAGTFGILYVSVAAFHGSIGFGCPLLVHPAVLIPIPLTLPAASFSLPAVLPAPTPSTTINLQYIGDKGGGVPYATNGLQMMISN